MSTPPIQITCGDDAVFDVAISSSGGALAASDIILCRFEVRADPNLSAAITKDLGAGVAITGVTNGVVAALVTLTKADTASLTPGVSYFYDLICATAVQKNLCASGYITINQPTI